ncbi:CRAL-TRIO domain-containing protein [Phlyctochytrium arcticum]|nr:CRAL-TRIO domain-containing protein [Phlyctochytrium arcticum]
MSTLDLDNLSETQKTDAIAQFRKLLTEEQNAAHDDRELLRFLIARQLDATRAHEMLLGYLQWRKDDKIDDLPLPGVNGNPVMQNVRGFDCVKDANWDMKAPGMPEEYKSFYDCMGGGCFHKVDKDGIPIFIERTGYHDVKGLAVKCPTSVMLDWHIRNNEFIFNVLMPECSKKKGEHVGKHIVIFDCTGLGIWQFNMTGLFLLKAVSDLDSRVYPERLGKLFIVNTPGLFSKAWNIIKGWLDKRILEKIFICGIDYKEVLLQHVDAENLPDFLGGTCKCKHMPGGCVPSPYLERTTGCQPSDYEFSTTVGSSGHEYEVNVPEEGLLGGGNIKMTYKFKTTKKPVHFELRHRPLNGEEIVLVPSLSQDSHKEPFHSELEVQPGTYIFNWQKPAGGFSMFNSLSLDYSVDLGLDTSAESEPRDSVPNVD